jgi:hypothetical protein
MSADNEEPLVILSKADFLSIIILQKNQPGRAGRRASVLHLTHRHTVHPARSAISSMKRMGSSKLETAQPLNRS